MQRPLLTVDDAVPNSNLHGQFYTTYPTVDQFTETVTEEIFKRAAAASRRGSIAPLALHLYMPCSQQLGGKMRVAAASCSSRQYLDYLCKEIKLQSPLAGCYRTVTRMHWGGGAAGFLDGAELTELMHQLARHYPLSDSMQREFSIEIDADKATSDRLALLKGLGFNRLRVAVLDFDWRVQRAIGHRITVSQIQRLTEQARLYQFASVSYQLMYGLPGQSIDSLKATLEKVINLAPDRVTYRPYMPFAGQRIPDHEQDKPSLPSAEQQAAMLLLIVAKLQGAGYRSIGQDQFVRPQDDLARVQSLQSLQCCVQGDITGFSGDILGLGVSAISALEACYAQNEGQLMAYYARLDAGELPICRGVSLTDDDRLRRAVITQLLCYLQLDIAALELQFTIVFADYFRAQWPAIQVLQTEGLLVWQAGRLVVTPRGRAELSTICALFDRYVRPC